MASEQARQQGHSTTARPKTEKNTKEREDPIKKKLHGFLSDLLKFGSLKGFRYFTMYLRGREELVVHVLNEQTCSANGFVRCESHGFDEIEEEDSSDSFPNKKMLPRNSESFILSRDTQRSLSGFKFLKVGLPPASPCRSEISPFDPNYTTFLIAAYSRYRSPYVWVRSNHERLIKLSKFDDDEEKEAIKDSPLSIKTVGDWANKDIKIWNIVSEIVKLNVFPSPRNPFAVDHTFFDTLCLQERVIVTGAMVHFLQKLRHEDHSYNSKVSSDLHEVTKRHFKEFRTFLQRSGKQS